MKNMKKLITIPLVAFAIYGITSCTPTKPYSVEFGQGYKCETRSKEGKIKFFKDGKRIGEKYKNQYGDEVYWFINDKGDSYEERRGVFRISSPTYRKKSIQEYQEYVNKKIKEGKKMLEELKEGEYLLERLINKK